MPPKSNTYTICFVTVLCLICALILSTLASVLKKPQEDAKKIYQSEQLLIAAGIINHQGNFQIKLDGEYVPASFKDGYLAKTPEPKKPTPNELLEIFEKRIEPMLTNIKGDTTTFAKANIDYEEYLAEYQKNGFSQLNKKLYYVIYSNDDTQKTIGYVIPINGFGLWDAIYGYLGLQADANTVIGATWYEQAETPGLGGDIALPPWQNQFPGKVIFQENKQGETIFDQTSLGIKVVKTTVNEELGSSPASKSAVDGISGATISSKGVADAYRTSLKPYRAFLIKAHKEST